MNFKDFIAEENDNDRRIDRFVLKLLPSMNISVVCSNLRSGFIRLNGKKTKNSERIFTGDKISIEEHLFSRFAQESLQNSIVQHSVYEDFLPSITIFKNEHILIVNKKRGMLTQSSQKKVLDETSLDETKMPLDEIVRLSSPSSASFKAGPMHRLDKNTSGILCFSQSLKGARWFQSCMENHLTAKTYVALVKGIIPCEQNWVDEISSDFTKNSSGFYTGKIALTKMSPDESDTSRAGKITTDNKITDSKAKLAITKVTPLASCNGITLAQFSIKTGRHHQIRLQSAYHGFPLLFDTAYSKNHAKQNKNEHKTSETFFLHCIKMEFPQNDLGIPEKIICPIDDKFEETVKKILPNFDFKIYNNSL